MTHGNNPCGLSSHVPFKISIAYSYFKRNTQSINEEVHFFIIHNNNEKKNLNINYKSISIRGWDKIKMGIRNWGGMLWRLTD